MYANYHTHTYRCHHASGTPKEYVEQGIKNGLKVLGFSDHSPYVFDDGYYSNFRMSLEETEQYVNEIAELREVYKDKIQIYIGYEMEYYPKHFDKTIDFINQYEYDYLILGLHATNNEYDGAWTAAPCAEEDFKQYVKQVIEAIKTEKFLYIAHPDIIGYRENENIYKEEMLKLCNTALEYDLPLEFNLLGFEDKRAYPYKPFWELVSQVGNKVILGCDAHAVDRVAKKAVYESGLKYLVELGIEPIEKINMKKVEKNS